VERTDCRRRPAGIEATEEDTMPHQPADPIHYNMKIPPERKHNDKEREPAKKHGDKIDTETGNREKPAEGEDKGCE
jgi:hypothetical protein